jgi:hypothetical protein
MSPPLNIKQARQPSGFCTDQYDMTVTDVSVLCNVENVLVPLVTPCHGRDSTCSCEWL